MVLLPYDQITPSVVQGCRKLLTPDLLEINDSFIEFCRNREAASK